MPIETLRKIWLALALICFVVCLDFIGISLGWPVNFGTKLIFEFKTDDVTARQAPLYGLVYGLPLTCVAFWLAGTHAKRTHGSWATRFPFRLLDVDPDCREGRFFQWITVITFVALPIYALGHFWKYVGTAPMCFQYVGENKLYERKEAPVDNIWITDLKQGTDRSPWSIWDNSFRYDPSQANDKGFICHDGSTFQPILQPLLLVAATGLALWLFARLLIAMFQKQQAS